MRVALLAPPFESVPPRLYGGTERVVANLCRGLNEANVEVTLFASGDSYCEGRLVPVVEEALRLSRRPLDEPNLCHFQMISEVFKRADEFDVIHNHHDFWMLPLSEMVTQPFVTTLHGKLDIPGLGRVLDGYRNAHFVSISDSQRAPVRAKLNWAGTIRHGLDCESFRFQEKPGTYLAFLGRMDTQKRPDLAIRIAKRSGVPLKIAAKIEGRAMEQYYETHVKPEVDGRFIEYVGEISESEKQDFLGNALALTFPIDWPEPFGLAMIEALACGTPVLARPVGSVREVLSDGVTGYISLDVDALAARVPDVSRLDRARCRRWVEEKFSLKRMTEDYIHVYQTLIQSAAFGRRAGGSRLDRHRRDFIYPVERLADGNS